MAVITQRAIYYGWDHHDMSEQEVIEQIRSGKLDGFENNGEWFVRYETSLIVQNKSPMGAIIAYRILGISLLCWIAFLIVQGFHGFEAYEFALFWLGLPLIPLFLLLALIAQMMSLRRSSAFLFAGFVMLILYIIKIFGFLGLFLFPFQSLLFLLLLYCIVLIMSLSGNGNQKVRKSIRQSYFSRLGFSTVIYFGAWCIFFSPVLWDFLRQHDIDPEVVAHVIVALTIPYAFICIYVPKRVVLRKTV